MSTSLMLRKYLRNKNKTYKYEQAIGSGSFGVVVKAERISDPSEKRAIKIIKKNKLILTDDLKNEIQIMKELVLFIIIIFDLL